MSYSRRPQSAAPSAARGGATQARVHASDSLPRRYVIPEPPSGGRVPAATGRPYPHPELAVRRHHRVPFVDDPARAAGGTAQDRRLRQTGGRLVRIPAGLAVRRDVAPARHHGAERTGGPERHPQAARPLRLRGRPEPGSGAVAPAGQARGRVRDRHGSARRTPCPNRPRQTVLLPDRAIVPDSDKQQTTFQQTTQTTFRRRALLAPDRPSPPVIALALKDGSEYAVTESQAAEWRAAYRELNVDAELCACAPGSTRNRRTARHAAASARSWWAG